MCWDHYLLDKRLWFPRPEKADGSGVLAIGGDLSVGRLLLAYRTGVFPWFREGEPILWWCPDPRFVLYPERFKLRRSLKKTLKSGKFEIRYDTAFSEVIDYCSRMPRPGQDGTWITQEMLLAYNRFHEAGYAHSVETFLDGKLAGGLYGVAIGPFFFGESMFYVEPEASKVALAALVDRFKKARFIDCQVHNRFFESMGAEHIPRINFLNELRAHIDKPDLW